MPYEAAVGAGLADERPLLPQRVAAMSRTAPLAAAHLSFVLLFLLASFLPAAASETQLQSDYSGIEDQRIALEEKRVSTEQRREKLEGDRKRAEKLYSDCKSARWSVHWKDQAEDANKARSELETQNARLRKLNGELEDLRIELDASRRQIEASNRVKGTRYEAEFRDYMARMTTEYYPKVNQELLGGYDTYFNGIEAYISFLDECTEDCNNATFTGAISSAANEKIRGIWNAVSTLRGE